MVSLKDVAKLCHVSIATASKALNDHDDVSEKTKKIVRKTAKEVGYFPNAAAQSMKTKRTYNIGVLYQDEANSSLTHEYFAHILESFKETISLKGYDLTFINSKAHDYKEMTYLEHCMYRNFDGVMIACIDFSNPEVIELVNSDLPVVTIDHTFNNATAVVSDNADGMQQLLEYILAMGHKKIAYIHGFDSAVTRQRLGMFNRILEDHGIKLPDAYIRECAYLDADATNSITKELLQLEDKPTCIMYPDDFSALGGITAITKSGRNIPEDISVVGYDGSSISRAVTPSLTTLKQNVEKIGQEAGQRLIEEIEKPNHTYPEVILVKGELQKGETVKNLN